MPEDSEPTPYGGGAPLPVRPPGTATPAPHPAAPVPPGSAPGPGPDVATPPTSGDPTSGLPASDYPPAYPPATPWTTSPPATDLEPHEETASGNRRSIVTMVIVAAIVLLLAGGGIAYLVVSGPGPVPPVSPAAQRLLRSSLTAAERKGSFHYVSTSSSQGLVQTTVGDAGRTSGTQDITVGPGTSDKFTVVVVGTACYFKGTTRSMVQNLGLSVTTASAHSGAWISLSPGDAPYASVYAAVTLRSALADNVDFVPHRRLGATRVAGHRVIGVSGPLKDFTVAGVSQKAKGTARLYIDAARPRVPVRYSEKGSISGQPTKFTITFSHWGKHLHVTAPSGALAFSSLGPVTTTPSGSPSLVSVSR